LERALKLSEKCLLGVNNRNLKNIWCRFKYQFTFEETTWSVTFIGHWKWYCHPADIAMMQDHDIHAFLRVKVLWNNHDQIRHLLRYLVCLSWFKLILLKQ
jgi:indole-3-glycerol phosphate synthase